MEPSIKREIRSFTQPPKYSDRCVGKGAIYKSRGIRTHLLPAAGTILNGIAGLELQLLADSDIRAAVWRAIGAWPVNATHLPLATGPLLSISSIEAIVVAFAAHFFRFVVGAVRRRLVGLLTKQAAYRHFMERMARIKTPVKWK